MDGFLGQALSDFALDVDFDVVEHGRDGAAGDGAAEGEGEVDGWVGFREAACVVVPWSNLLGGHLSMRIAVVVTVITILKNLKTYFGGGRERVLRSV